MDQLKEVENKTVCAGHLGNSSILTKEAEKDNPENENCDLKSESHSVVGIKTEFPVIDLTELNSANEKAEGKPNNSKNDADSTPLKNAANEKLNLEKCCPEEFWLTEAPRNGISSETGEGGQKIYKLTQVRSCPVEHNYCRIGKFGFLPRKIKIRKSTCLKTQSGGTFKFQNGSVLAKERMEQQTIGIGNSITTKHVDPNSDLSTDSSVKVGLKRKAVNENNINSHCAADVSIEQKAVRFLTPKIRIRKSKGSGDYYDVIVQDSASMPPPLAAKPDSSEIKTSDKKLGCQNSGANDERKLESRKRVISSDDIAGEVLEMEKIGESRSDTFKQDTGKHEENMGLKSNEVPPVKIRKLSSKEDVSQSQNQGGFVLSKPNLMKTMPEGKNWNLEYTEDDVKNLGLDDLLLKASELNAENFTKALGQSSGGRNGNKVESSDILLSFPAGKRESDEPLDGGNSKGGNTKKAKLEILKKCVLDDNFMKCIEEESLKKIPDQPKKPGIKVKTVQNINEEFKDSLGAKMKMMEGRDVAPESSIPVFTINDDIQECNQTKEVFIQEKTSEKQPPSLNYTKVNQQQNLTKNVDGISGETRPYVMTIVQNKENHAKNHIPATLTPKVFIKPKSVFPNRATLLPAIQGRPGDAANNTMAVARDPNSKSNDNVTFVVPEPRSFELVNVDGYPDPGAKKMGINSHFVLNYGTLTKKDSEGKNLMHGTFNGGVRMKNIPILVSRDKKFLQMPLVNGQKVLIGPADDKRINSGPNPQSMLVNSTPEGTENIRRENNSAGIPSFTISSIEPRVITKDAGSGIAGGNCIQVIQKVVSPTNAHVIANTSQPVENTNLEVQNDGVSQQRPQLMSLLAFANTIKDILPDKWILSMDKKFGLEILKTHLDDYLNPAIMMSVVVGRAGKVTVNVRGRQLEHSHELFNNLCDVGTSQEKISINYVLAIMNRLRFYSICFGCDDLSLKKYWCEDGFIEYYTEFQQTYRSHICESLIRMGRKRCHPCYRIHESLKKRRRREIIAKKAGKLPKPKPVENIVNVTYSMTHNSQERGTMRRTLEDYMDESFYLMKRSIKEEIQRIKEKEESERVPKTQDEVLGSMGLARKESLDVNVRKSKREKKGFNKFDPLFRTNVNKEELYFLERYWREINVLYTTSLLVGGYSRLSTGVLKDKCKKFYRLLSTWRKIVRDNAVCVGGYISLAENLVNDGETVNSEAVKKKFDNMDDAALRSYATKCVKELNRMKNKLRTKNKCFMALYNSYMKPNLKKAKQASESAAQKNGAKKKKTPEKSKKAKASTSTEVGSSD